MNNLNTLLKPKSIAVIGASRDNIKLGRLVLDNIIESGFKGKVYPVNPKASKIAGFKAYKSVTNIQKKVDLAVIAIPSKFVLEVVQECGESGVKSIIIISAGFSESGHEGVNDEIEIMKLTEKYDMQILGPNCLGIISSGVNLNATFAQGGVKNGNIAFLSQSGALGTAILDWAQINKLGFSYFISLGNKSDLNENDFLKFLNQDDDVEAIAFYLEDFKDGKKFMKLAEKISKPIIVLKPGKSEAAQKALGSHTGSLAQDDSIVSAALRQAGIIRVKSVEELFNVMSLFSNYDRLSGSKIAVLTNAGGPGVIITDSIYENGLKLTELTTKTHKELAMKLPSASSLANPIDVLGDALADRYELALEALVKDENVGEIIVLLTPQVMTQVERTARIISEKAEKSSKPILSVFIGGHEVNKGREILNKAGQVCFSFPEDCVRTVKYLSNKKDKKSKPSMKLKSFDKYDVKRILKKKNGSLDARSAEQILAHYNLPVIKSKYPKDEAGCRRVVDQLGFPMVMKLVHPELLHKTDIEAVRIGIESEKEMMKHFRELTEIADEKSLKDYRIQIQPQIKNGLELILGVKRHDDSILEVDGKKFTKNKGFGHSIIFGKGGIYAEIYKDVSIGICPLREGDVFEMLESTKVYEALTGARGKEYKIDELAATILRLSRLCEDFPQIKELDINPLIATEEENTIVDVKMFVD